MLNMDGQMDILATTVCQDSTTVGLYASNDKAFDEDLYESQCVVMFKLMRKMRETHERQVDFEPI
jgi:hypothetical protein